LPSSKVPRRLRDIIENAEAILRYTKDMDAAAFAEDDLVRNAVERCFERICEASAKLGDMAGDLMPGHPWRKIRSLGNVLRHEYDDIEHGRLFEIVRNDLPGLLAGARDALQRWESSKRP
jgi:uncharacterized protein with HEPN domain